MKCTNRGVLSAPGFKFLILLNIFLGHPSVWAADQGGLKTSVAVDLVGSFPFGEETAAVQYQSKESFKLRSAEFMFYAPIDPRFDGVLSFAAHPEGSQAYGEPEVHEAYLASTKIIDSLRFKVGQFFLGIGRINQIHQHDWPFITPTVMQRELFASDEGIIDTGVEVAALMPLPFYLDVTLGVTNGRDFGHSHVEDDVPRTPTHYSRVVTFTDAIGLPTQIGLNYVGRTSAIGEMMKLYGIDITGKIRVLGHMSWLVQAELWKRELTLEGTTDELVGGYGYLQHYLSRDLAVGVRYDYSSVTSAKENNRSGYEINMLYFSSEFARIGLAYYHNKREQKGRDHEETNQMLLQTAFILGAHPSHNF